MARRKRASRATRNEKAAATPPAVAPVLPDILPDILQPEGAFTVAEPKPFEEVRAAEDLSDLPPVLQEAIAGFSLRRADVLGHRVIDEHSAVIVTRGGRKLRWPEDQARELTQAERDGIGTDFPRYFKHGIDGKRV